MITVRELIHQLSKFNPDDPVILQKDTEGNGYSPVEAADTSMWFANWRGGECYEPDEAPKNSMPCVVIYPVN